MIHAVEVRHFQSLHHVRIDLAPLTVIVGPSSSGKSAFTRAMRTLTSNRRGTDFITHGERTCTISATTERGTVTLTRGKGTSDNAYTVTPLDPTEQKTYTKLGGDTPPEVSAFLGIAAKDPINYAGQFDKPYMLDDSGNEVARILGALTNVHVIFEGARESNRRKLQSAATLRTRADDLTAIKNRVPQFQAIKQQDAALTEAEALIEKALTIQRSIARLTEATQQYDLAMERIDALTPLATQADISDAPIVQAHARLTEFTDALRANQAAQQAVATSQSAYDAVDEEEATLMAAYTQEVARIAGDLGAWFEEQATDPTRTQAIDGKQFVEQGYAVSIFTQYLEARA